MVIEIGINHEPAIDAIVTRLAKAGRISLVELIVDGYHRTVPELREMIDRFGLAYSFHCVLMSLGSVGFPKHDVSLIREAVAALPPLHWSEHLTFSRSGDVDLVQNLGMPMTTDMAMVFARNIKRALRGFPAGVPFLVENIASQWRFDASHLSPDEFVSTIALQSGAGILLDVHNLYVDELNHGWNAERVIDGLPLELVDEVHIAGGRWLDRGRRVYLDSHDAKIPARVWEILRYLLKRRCPRALVLERSPHPSTPIEKFENEVIAELGELKRLAGGASARPTAPTQRANNSQPRRSPRRAKITPESQRRWLVAIGSPRGKPAGMQYDTGALSAVRAKYAEYARSAVGRVFPRFVEHAPLSREAYLEVLHGRDPHDVFDVDWLFSRTSALTRRISGRSGWLDLLRVERAVELAMRSSGTRLGDEAIHRFAAGFAARRGPVEDVGGVHFVRLTTDKALDYPSVKTSATLRAKPCRALAIFRRRSDSTPTLVQY